MSLPLLREIKKEKTAVTAFKGYNKNEFIPKDCFYDMQNIVADKYPLAVSREKRTVYKDFGAPVQAVEYRNGKLLYIKDGILYYGTDENGNDRAINTPQTALSAGEKEIVSMGSYALIYPDKMYFNTLGEEDGSYKLKNMQFHMHLVKDDNYDELLCPKEVTVGLGLVEAGDIDYEACRHPGQFTDGKEPNSSTDLYWLDSSYTLKKYVASAKTSYSIPNTNLVIRLSSPDLCHTYVQGHKNPIEDLKAGDCISFNCGVLNGTYEIKAIYWTEKPCESSMITPIIIVIDTPADLDYKKTFLKKGYLSCDEAFLDVKVPDIKYLTEASNRLWGVDEKNGEIRACRQGDFRAWDMYAGLSSDSYSVTVGSDGLYTGCCKYLNNILFFKEGSLCKLYGSKPSNYQLSYDMNIRSLERGSEKSACVIGDILYYKSADGICAYDGSEAVSISLPFGDEKYVNAVAIGYEGKYYVSMENVATSVRELFVYDTVKGIWNRLDNVNIKKFLTISDGLYAVEQVSEGDGGIHHRIIGLCRSHGSVMNEDVPWYIVSGNIGFEKSEHKYISGVSFAFEAQPDSDVTVSFSINGGEFETVYKFESSELSHHEVPLNLPRCDRFCWKLEGQGAFKLFSVHYMTEEGSADGGNI